MSEARTLDDDQEITWFWEEMETDVKSTLTPEQRIAIEHAVRKSTDHARPADLRLSFGNYFLRIIAGKERRNEKRLKQDLKHNPVFTWKNAPLILVFSVFWLVSVFYIAAFLTSTISNLLFR